MERIILITWSLFGSSAFRIYCSVTPLLFALYIWNIILIKYIYVLILFSDSKDNLTKYYKCFFLFFFFIKKSQFTHKYYTTQLFPTMIMIIINNNK